MRNFLIVLMSLSFIMCCGCDNTNTETATQNDVIINIPTDNTVNGYRDDATQSNPQNNTTKTDTEVSSKAEATVSSKNNTSNNKTETINQPENTSTQYCGNTNSKKFHYTSCGFVDKINSENRLYLSDRSELISLGYEPCKKCNP